MSVAVDHQIRHGRHQPTSSCRMFEAARPDKMPRLDLRVPWVMMRSVIGLSVVALLFIQAANGV
jgi:hypothetical protein